MSSMTQVNGPRISHLDSDDNKPERSRNAKAQARHRAKRKAYIEQLESTVTKLQTALGCTPDQVAALPPPLAKIRELEQENARLHAENDEMRRLMAEDPQTRSRIPSDFGRRNTFQDGRDCDERDYKKRKVGDGVYLSQNEQHHSNDSASRPPPLSIPQPMPHQYGSQSMNGSSTSLFNLQGPAFQMPNTPSGSSSTSSPPFSNFRILVTNYHLFTHQQPATMHPPLHSPAQHRPPSISAQHSLSNYNHSSNHYGSVKVEDDHYGGSRHNHHTHNSHYPHTTLPPFQSTQEPDWHSYAAERAQGHHR